MTQQPAPVTDEDVTFDLRELDRFATLEGPGRENAREHLWDLYGGRATTAHEAQVLRKALDTFISHASRGRALVAELRELMRVTGLTSEGVLTLLAGTGGERREWVEATRRRWDDERARVAARAEARRVAEEERRAVNLRAAEQVAEERRVATEDAGRAELDDAREREYRRYSTALVASIRGVVPRRFSLEEFVPWIFGEPPPDADEREFAVDDSKFIAKMTGYVAEAGWSAEQLTTAITDGHLPTRPATWTRVPRRSQRRDHVNVPGAEE